MALNNDNYFSSEANKEYMSVSQYKAFVRCEAEALANINGRPQEMTTPLLVGSYVDAYFSGELGKFIEEHPEIMTQKGTLRSDYKKADEIIARIQRDEVLMDYLSGDTQTVMTGELFGYKWKIKVDSLHDDKIVDLKVMKDLGEVYSPETGRVPFYIGWGYDIQGAIYQEIVRQNTGKKLPFYIAAASKEPVTDLRLIHLPDSMLEDALSIVEARIDHIIDVKSGLIEPTRCEKCNYCKETKVIKEPEEVLE